MFYLVQRTDCTSFGIAGDIDPAYERGLRAALTAGVEAVGYGCDISPDGITVARPLTLDLPVVGHT
jgi:sugar fermentation stimulation protein A